MRLISVAFLTISLAFLLAGEAEVSTYIILVAIFSEVENEN